MRRGRRESKPLYLDKTAHKVKFPPARQKTRFFLSRTLDNTRVNRDVQKILEEVVALLAQENARLELRFEVQASSPGGFSPSAMRDISENCRTLKIADFGFEEE